MTTPIRQKLCLCLKALNREHFTPIRNPTAADICQLHANAVAAFPGEPIVAVCLDISSAYNRLRVRPLDIPLGALLFGGSDATQYVGLGRKPQIFTSKW